MVLAYSTTSRPSCGSGYNSSLAGLFKCDFLLIFTGEIHPFDIKSCSINKAFAFPSLMFLKNNVIFKNPSSSTLFLFCLFVLAR